MCTTMVKAECIHKAGFGAYGSVVRGDAGDDEHEVEGDDELDDERLRVRPRRHRPEEVLPRVPEEQPQQHVSNASYKYYIWRGSNQTND